MAPGFEKLPSSVPGKSFSLADFKGKQNVVLAFFPLAFTGG
jgi:peroxiredoxin